MARTDPDPEEQDGPEEGKAPEEPETTEKDVREYPDKQHRPGEGGGYRRKGA